MGWRSRYSHPVVPGWAAFPPKKPELSVMEMRDMFAEACQRAGQMTKVSHIVGVVNSMRPGMHLEKMTEER